MILTFSRDSFVEAIKHETKKHTIRADKNNRWKVGSKIHFWRGNPRNTKGKTKPYQFGIGEVSRVEIIRMDFAIPEDWQQDIVYIGDDIVLKSENELNALAENDGFENWNQMKLWFDNTDKSYIGKIIFWKKFELTDVIKSVCDIEKGTKCNSPNIKYRTGVCRNCGGQATVC